MRMLKSKLSLVLFLSASLLAACSTQWDMRDSSQTNDAMATITQHPEMRSPAIYFARNRDTNTFKSPAGAQPDNDIFRQAGRELVIAPGEVHIGFTHSYRGQYVPEVRFTAEKAHSYYFSWICIPYSFAVIVDASSEEIVAIDEYCPECKKFIGRRLPANAGCDSRTSLGDNWENHRLTSASAQTDCCDENNQQIRNVCAAAESGVVGAQFRLASWYKFGWSRPDVPKDPVRGYVWSKDVLTLIRANPEEEEILADMQNMTMSRFLTRRESLTKDQLREADFLIQNWQPGQCAIELLGEEKAKSAYEISLN